MSSNILGSFSGYYLEANDRVGPPIRERTSWTCGYCGETRTGDEANHGWHECPHTGTHLFVGDWERFAKYED